MGILDQNSGFNLCLSPDGDGFRVSVVNDVNIYQDGENKFSPVHGGAETNELSKIEFFPDSTTAVVKTRITSDFFKKSNPSDIAIVGSVELDFLGSGKRHLRNNIFDIELEYDDVAPASFQLSASVRPLPTPYISSSPTSEKKEDMGNFVTEAQKIGKDTGAPINVIIAVTGAILTIAILAVGFRRFRPCANSALTPP